MGGLHWVDILIFSSFLVVSLAMGVYQALTGRKQQTTEEFFLANRRLKVLPTVLSLIASLRSAITVIGFPAEIYKWGTQMWLAGDVMGVVLAMIIVERFFVPWLYKLKITSAYEYLELRFQSKAVRRLASGIGILMSVLLMGTAIFSPAIAMQVAADFPLENSIYLMSTFCTVYTALGGMRAVIWTDVLQSLIMFGGILFIVVQGAKDVGGLASAINTSRSEGRLFFATFNPDPNGRLSFWTMLFAYTTSGLIYFGIQQSAVQRYVAIPTLKGARLMMLLYIPCSLTLSSLCGLLGIVQFAFFSNAECDPLQSGLATSANQLFPIYTKVLFKDLAGFNGFLLMILYSSALSTVSSLLSACAVNTWEDFLKPNMRCLSDYQATLLNKVLVVIFAVLGTGIAFLIAKVSSNILMVAISFSGAAGGPLLGMYLLGGLTRRCEWCGAFTGGVAGLFLNLFLGLGSVFLIKRQYVSLPPISTSGCASFFNSTQVSGAVNETFIPAYEPSSTRLFSPVVPLKGMESILGISSYWYALTGCLTTFIVGYIVSVVVCKLKNVQPPTVEKKYLLSLETALYLGESDSHKDEHSERQEEEMA